MNISQDLNSNYIYIVHSIIISTMDSKRKYLTGGGGPKVHGSKHHEQAAKYGGSAPGGMA